MSEEQFAESIQKDLNFTHPPNLIPFLKVCNVLYVSTVYCTSKCYK